MKYLSMGTIDMSPQQVERWNAAVDGMAAGSGFRFAEIVSERLGIPWPKLKHLPIVRLLRLTVEAGRHA